MADSKKLVQRIDSFRQAFSSAPNDLSVDDQRRAALVLACSPLRRCIFEYFSFEIGQLRRNVDQLYESEKMSEPDAWKCLLEEKRALSNECTFDTSVSEAWRDILAEYEKKLLNDYEFAEPDEELAREVVRSFPIVNKDMYGLFMRQLAKCDENGTVRQRIEEMWKLDDGKTNKQVPEISKSWDRKPQWGLIDDNVNVRCRECDAVFRKPAKNFNHSMWPYYVYSPGARVRQVKRGKQPSEPLIGVVKHVEPENPIQSPFSVEYTVKWDEERENKCFGKQLQPQPCDCGDDHLEDCHWKHIHRLIPLKDKCNHGNGKSQDSVVSWGVIVDSGDDGRFQLYQLFGPKEYIKSKDKWIPTPPANETALLHIVAGLTPDPLIRRVADAVRMRTRNHWGHDTVPEFEHRCYISLMVTFVELMCNAMSVDADDYREKLEKWLNLENVASVKISKEMVDELMESLTKLKELLPYEELSVKVAELDERVGALESNKVNRNTTLPVCLTTTPMLKRDEHVARVCELIQQSSAPVAIVGDAGIGKTTLAKMVGKAMVDQFDNDVHFLVVGQSLDIELCQRDLYKSLGGDVDDDKIKEMTRDVLHRELEKLLNDRKALIILDDVWDLSNAVSLGCSSDARFLITSRQRSVVDEITDSSKHQLGLLSDNEAKELLLEQTGLDWVDEPCDWLLEFCGGLILAVRIVGSMVRKKSKSRGQYSGTGAWIWIRNVLKNKSIEGLESSVEERLDVALQKSIESLGDIKDRFYDLSLFPENETISCSLLKEWWFCHGNASLAGEFDDWIYEFDSLSLIMPGDDDTLMTFRLHLLVSKFLQGQNDDHLYNEISTWIWSVYPAGIIHPILRTDGELDIDVDMDRCVLCDRVLRFHGNKLVTLDTFVYELLTRMASNDLSVVPIMNNLGLAVAHCEPLIEELLALASNTSLLDEERFRWYEQDRIYSPEVLSSDFRPALFAGDSLKKVAHLLSRNEMVVDKLLKMLDSDYELVRGNAIQALLAMGGRVAKPNEVIDRLLKYVQRCSYVDKNASMLQLLTQHLAATSDKEGECVKALTQEILPLDNPLVLDMVSDEGESQRNAVLALSRLRLSDEQEDVFVCEIMKRTRQFSTDYEFASILIRKLPRMIESRPDLMPELIEWWMDFPWCSNDDIMIRFCQDDAMIEDVMFRLYDATTYKQMSTYLMAVPPDLESLVVDRVWFLYHNDILTEYDVALAYSNYVTKLDYRAIELILSDELNVKVVVIDYVKRFSISSNSEVVDKMLATIDESNSQQVSLWYSCALAYLDPDRVDDGMIRLLLDHMMSTEALPMLQCLRTLVPRLSAVLDDELIESMLSCLCSCNYYSHARFYIALILFELSSYRKSKELASSTFNTLVVSESDDRQLSSISLVMPHVGLLSLDDIAHMFKKWPVDSRFIASLASIDDRRGLLALLQQLVDDDSNEITTRLNALIASCNIDPQNLVDNGRSFIDLVPSYCASSAARILGQDVKKMLKCLSSDIQGQLQEKLVDVCENNAVDHSCQLIATNILWNLAPLPQGVLRRLHRFAEKLRDEQGADTSGALSNIISCLRRSGRTVLSDEQGEMVVF